MQPDPRASMTFAARRLAIGVAVLLLGAVSAVPARADSLVSSASSAGSASSDSVSNSLNASSNSSRRDDEDRRVSEGEYRVVAVTDVAERADRLRLELQPAGRANAAAISLDLPRQALPPQGIAAGDVVSARRRDYGFEFARTDTREPFFLLLADDWYRELGAHVVTTTAR